MQITVACAGVATLLLAVVAGERRRANEALRRTRHELEARVRERTAELEYCIQELALQSTIGANMAEGVVLVRVSDGTIVYASPTFERMFGYETGELEGRHVSVLNAATEKRPEDTASEIMAAVRAHGSWRGEIDNVRKDGARFWCWANVSAFEHPEHGTVWLAVHADISERKLAGNELKKRESQLAEAQRMAQIGSWEWDIERNEVSWSDELYRIHGLEPDQFAASYEAFLAGVHPDDRAFVDGIVRQAFEDRQPFDYHHRCVRPSGEERVLHAQGQVEVDEAGRPVRMLGTCQDVTELKRAERLKDEFFATVSHELRTPLTSIIGYTDLLLSGEGGDVSTEQRRFLEITERNARRQLRLVNDLLFVSKAEAGEFAIEAGRVELDSLMRDCVESASPSARKKGIEFVQVTGSVPACQGDPDRLAQLADNLVSNAIKFTPAGGKVEVRLGVAGNRALLEVMNTGSHISPEERRHLFDRFYRAPSASDEAVQGVGLGLTISKAIAEAHDGSIEVESDERTGTTFRVTLPLRPPPKVIELPRRFDGWQNLGLHDRAADRAVPPRL